ncbi:MAG: hypothetical protein ACE5NN_07535 [Candidatus Bathyarchaeia archaeon]
MLYVAVILIGFGVFNLSTSNLATAQQDGAGTTPTTQLVDIIVERLISEIGPIVAGAVLIAIQFARKQGLRISAEAEEYFVNAAKSFVENQSRFLYKKIRDNPEYRDYLVKGRIPPKLGKEALESVKEQLRVELQSDEFTRAARDMLDKNLETLIERYVTENKKELAEKGRRLLNELVPVAVDAALLSFDKPEDARKNKDKIIKEALESVAKTFDFEELLFSDDDATMRIKSELNRRIGGVR